MGIQNTKLMTMFTSMTNITVEDNEEYTSEFEMYWIRFIPPTTPFLEMATISNLNLYTQNMFGSSGKVQIRNSVTSMRDTYNTLIEEIPSIYLSQYYAGVDSLISYYEVSLDDSIKDIDVAIALLRNNISKIGVLAILKIIMYILLFILSIVQQIKAHEVII